MKKNLILSGLGIVVGFSLIYFFFFKEKAGSTKEEASFSSNEKLKNNLVSFKNQNINKTISRKTMSVDETSDSFSEKVLPKNAFKKRVSRNFFLDDYPKTNLNFFQANLQLVEGVEASKNKRSDETPVGNFLDYHVYETPGVDSYQIVYSPEKKLYGIFTGEIVVTGGAREVLSLLEKNSFEVLYRNDVTQKVIFKINQFNDLNQLQEIKSFPGVKPDEMRPDIKFSRVEPL